MLKFSICEVIKMNIMNDTKLATIILLALAMVYLVLAIICFITIYFRLWERDFWAWVENRKTKKKQFKQHSSNNVGCGLHSDADKLQQ